MDVYKWLSALGDQVGSLDENERETDTCLF
jgi:hypothetical protein